MMHKGRGLAVSAAVLAIIVIVWFFVSRYDRQPGSGLSPPAVGERPAADVTRQDPESGVGNLVDSEPPTGGIESLTDHSTEAEPPDDFDPSVPEQITAKPGSKELLDVDGATLANAAGQTATPTVDLYNGQDGAYAGVDQSDAVDGPGDPITGDVGPGPGESTPEDDQGQVPDQDVDVLGPGAGQADIESLGPGALSPDEDPGPGPGEGYQPPAGPGPGAADPRTPPPPPN